MKPSSLRRWLVASARRLVRRGSYLAAYRRDTDRRVKDDPHAAVGGMWDVIGPLQFDYLKDRGLAPNHSMLDIGCGTLRGGRHFIKYLEPGRYTGFDISPEAIAFAKQLVTDEGLTAKAPRLLVAQPRLDFADLAGARYDVLLAQSVFTHLPAENIEECFANVGKVLADGGTFWFTFVERDAVMRESWKAFRYPFAFFADLATKHGFTAELRTDYAHPRSQKMVRLTR